LRCYGIEIEEEVELFNQSFMRNAKQYSRVLVFFFFFGKDSRVLVKHVNKINKLKKKSFFSFGGL
jgi:hypothetical protein